MLHRLIIFVFLFFLCLPGQSATFYFSSSEGVDSHTVQQAQNPETPWQSIQKLNSIFLRIQPGDSILLKRGDTFYGTLVISKSGSLKSPIFFGSYSSGDNPIMTGFKELKVWESKGGYLYEANIPEITNTLNVVLINNSLQEMGRYPNSSASNSGYLTIESYGDGKIESKGLNQTGNLTGGEIVIRKNNWIIDRHIINSNSLTSINFDYNTSNNLPMVGYGFFVQNHPSTLDAHGEWYYDKNNKKLIMYYKEDPSNINIKASVLNEIIINQNKASNIIFENINFRGSNENLINITGSTNFILQNCNLEYIGQNAINSVYSRNLKISNTTIKNSLNGGVFLGWNDIGLTINNCTFENIYNFPGMGKSGEMQGQAIYMSETSSDAIINNNKFLNSGYNAINFSGNNITIKNNLIDTYCFIKDDGAGIYTFTGPNKSPFTNRKIIGNTIINGIGAVSGTKPFGISDLPYVEGIYLDNFVSGIEIDSNTISNVKSKGIFLNNSNNISITNNKILNTGYSIYIRSERMENNPSQNILVENNEFLAISDSQFHLYIRTNFDDLSKIGKFNNNIFSGQINNTKTIYLQTPTINNSINLPLWKKTYSLDENSSKGPVDNLQIHSPEKKYSKIDDSILFDYNHSIKSKTITLIGKYIDLRGNISNGKIEIPPYSSIILLKLKN